MLADNDDIALNFTEENPGANQEAEGSTLGAGEDVTAGDLDVVYDDANGDYYVFLSAGDIDAATLRTATSTKSSSRSRTRN